MNRQQSILLSSVLLTGLITFSLGWFFAKNTSSPSGNSIIFQPASGTGSEQQQIPIRNLNEVWEILTRTYYDSAKLELPKLEDGAVKGFVAGIGDPYTVFMNPEESKDFEDGLEGQVEGIGAELEVKDGKLTVVSPLKDSPAQRAGIRSGDVILKINDKIAGDLTFYDAIKNIRGQKGTQVVLTIVREGTADPFDVSITRDSIIIQSVTVEKLEGDIFHVSVNQFNDHMKNEFQNAVQRMLLERATGVILDLRGNGGGYLDTSTDIVSEFVSGERTVAIIKKRNEPNSTVRTNGNAHLTDIPLVVLVDKGSASASEIVAGALQDYKRAVLIGEKTFGKGSVQEIDNLRDGSRLRITIAKWFTPLDRSIDDVGITPDIEVIMTNEDRQQDKDPQLEEAVRHLQRNNR